MVTYVMSDTAYTSLVFQNFIKILFSAYVADPLKQSRLDFSYRKQTSLRSNYLKSTAESLFLDISCDKCK